MDHNFDEIIRREGTQCFKYDFREVVFGREDVIPLWVADMDFPVPDFVSQAIVDRTKHPIYGYTVLSEGYYASIINWEKARHGWEIQKDWIHNSPGIVTAINLLVQALTEPGDPVIVQPPVYFPFFWAVEKNGRKLLHNQLIEKEGSWSIDYDDLEDKLKQGAKMLILCNPHNPVGRVWSRDELETMGNLCLKYNALIISDEIHCDLVYEGYKHTPMANISEALASQTITCIAPSKTFNLAGLSTSSIIISNDELREKYKKHEEKVHLSLNIFGVIASEAAYTHGAEWVDSLMLYLRENAVFVQQYLEQNIPGIRMSDPEATYLLWLDFRSFKMNDKTIRKKLIEEAGVGLNDGRILGPG